MGKIKLKSSKKKIVAKETGQRKRSVEELRRTLGFPDDTEFLGYAVYLKESDEFLAEFNDSPKEGGTQKIWAKTPQLAACYKTLTKAFTISKECSRSVVVGLFDTSNKIMTVTMSVNR